MIRIKKNAEPFDWKRYRETPGVSYEARPKLRDSLLKEQGYLCAYCMCRISREKSRIEHLQSRKNHPEKQLNYNNMVICCEGNHNGKESCDRKKGDRDITFNLFSDKDIATLRYSSRDGTIRSTNPTYDDELNKLLNLNNGTLKDNRHQAYRGLITELSKKKWTPKTLRKQREEWAARDEEGQFSPYLGIVLWHLDKWLSRHKG